MTEWEILAACLACGGTGFLLGQVFKISVSFRKNFHVSKDK